MRILLLSINYAPERTGIAPYSTELAQHLSAKHKVTVLTGVPHYPHWQVPREFRTWRRVSKEGGVTVVRLRHFVPKTPTVPSRGLYELTWAARAVVEGRRREADVVIAVVPALLAAQVARWIARHHGIPYGVCVQDVMGQAPDQAGVPGGRFVSGLTSRIESSALREAAGVTTIHDRLADEIAVAAKRYPTVIHNWTHVRSRPRQDSSLRASLGWPPGRVVVLHSGNMGWKQDLETVIAAGHLADQTDSGVVFVLAGDGSQRTKLSRAARNCRNVFIMDPVDDASYMDLLAAADVLLVNERAGMKSMSLPSKLTSYFVSGRPVVAATDASSATAAFVRSAGGIVVRAGEPARLLSAVETLGNDQQLSRTVADAGRSFAESHLTPEAAMSAYESWVERLGAVRMTSASDPPADSRHEQQ